MTPLRSVIRLLAVAVTLVMVTGVALPAVAQACMMMMEHTAVANVCCLNGEQHAPPCHDEPEEEPDEAPFHRHLDAKACCPASEGTAFDEAVRYELKEAASLGLVARAALESEITAPLRAPLRAGPDTAAERAGSGIGFHILYGVMLN